MTALLDRLEAVARAATPDERHERVVSLFPGGLKPDEFRALALHSADADGKIDPPSLSDWWTTQSLLMGMYIKGLIEKHGEGRMYDRTGPWFITDKGRAAIRNLAQVKT